MQKHVLRIFQREVERQCKFAVIAAEDMNKALQITDTDRLWYSIQAFLVAAGNVSKLLWSPCPQIPERAEELKKSLGVGPKFCAKIGGYQTLSCTLIIEVECCHWR